MAISKEEFERANARMAERSEGPVAVAVRYDPAAGRVIVGLTHGVEFTFPTNIAEGLAGANPFDLAEIEISPAGLGLHWPRLDADLYLPALLAGVFGSKRWMAAELGAAGGRARSEAKTIASRENGRRGGRPRKRAS
jgi:hypothetical protein